MNTPKKFLLKIKLAILLIIATLLLALGQTRPAYAANEIFVDGVTCTLAQAIEAANKNKVVANCHEGSPIETDIIVLGVEVIIDDILPVISSKIILEGKYQGIVHTIDLMGVDNLDVAAMDGHLTVNNTIIINGGNNLGGGGIRNFGTVIISNSTFRDNVAGFNGGGIWNSGTLTINNSTFITNHGGTAGGAIWNSGSLEINNSTLHDNDSVEMGGGIYNQGSKVNVTNSTISGNSSGEGGGIFNTDGPTRLNYSTLTGNRADSSGGGIRNLGTVELYRSLISGNSAAMGAEVNNTKTVAASEYNVIGYSNDSRSVGYVPDVLKDIIPLGALDTVLDSTLASNGGPTLTHALVPGSPAIDSTPNEKCTDSRMNKIDQRGFDRPVDEAGIASNFDCDAGSFEYQTLLPKKLAIYYAWPSGVNKSNGDVDTAVKVFNKYDIVVFADGLQDPSHGDHIKTVEIIEKLKTRPNRTAVYGYVPIGNLSGNGLTLDQIYKRVADWEKMGVAGIFLDEAGYNFNVSRDRQNASVDCVRDKIMECDFSQGLSVFINAWEPKDVFGNEKVPMNPMGSSTHLGPTDIYLLESFQITFDEITGKILYQDPQDWARKSDDALRYKNDPMIGTQIATVTRVSVQNPEFDKDKFEYAWYSTLLYGFEYMGWGEAEFSASGPTIDKLPFYDRPAEKVIGNVGSKFLLDNVTHDFMLQVHTRTTDTGKIEVNTREYKGKFTPN